MVRKTVAASQLNAGAPRHFVSGGRIAGRVTASLEVAPPGPVFWMTKSLEVLSTSDKSSGSSAPTALRIKRLAIIGDSKRAHPYRLPAISLTPWHSFIQECNWKGNGILRAIKLSCPQTTRTPRENQAEITSGAEHSPAWICSADRQVPSEGSPSEGSHAI